MSHDIFNLGRSYTPAQPREHIHRDSDDDAGQLDSDPIRVSDDELDHRFSFDDPQWSGSPTLPSKHCHPTAEVVKRNLKVSVKTSRSNSPPPTSTKRARKNEKSETTKVKSTSKTTTEPALTGTGAAILAKSPTFVKSVTAVVSKVRY